MHPRFVALLLFLGVVVGATYNYATHNESLHWGTYRPNLYFGLKTRSPTPLTFGLMWNSVSTRFAEWQNFQNIRHACEQNDKLKSYGWKQHDGFSYGKEEILDKSHNLNLTITYVKHEPAKKDSQWTVKVQGTPLIGGERWISFFFYFANANPEGSLRLKTAKTNKGTPEVKLEGHSDEEGKFAFIVREGQNTVPDIGMKEKHLPKVVPDFKKFQYFGLKNDPAEDYWKIDSKVKSLLEFDIMEKVQYWRANNQSTPILPHWGTLPNTIEKNANQFVFQKYFQNPFEIEFHFEILTSEDSKPTFADSSLGFSRQNIFETQFESVFSLNAKNYTPKQVQFAQAAFSNLIGGIGYFCGNWLLESQIPGEAQALYQPEYCLYTAVPSRPFFPRGFLWDEGFHELIISEWNPHITMDVARHWFSTMNQDGWIPREQILGDEARSKVPAQFQAQNPAVGNPPSFIFAILNLIHKYHDLEGTLPHMEEATLQGTQFASSGQVSEKEIYTRFFQGIFPKLKLWFEWFEKSQTGNLPNSFRWRMRTVNHTLPSGLDDYPRYPIPNNGELHLDLLSWMAKFSSMLAQIAKSVEPQQEAKYLELSKEYLKALDDIHWDKQNGMYFDSVLKPDGSFERVSHIGYVSFFPFMLGLIPANSPKMEKILENLSDRKHVWSDYGIRSLSISDAYFGKDENYWKGPIWMNMNYLILSSLYRYKEQESPYKEKFTTLYDSLRENLVKNLYENYIDSGYIWEQYHPITGKGQRSHPFTGWSSLIVLIMSEKYI